MKILLSGRLLFIAVSSLIGVAAPAQAATVVQYFGPNGADAPQFIAELETTIGSKIDLAPGYQAIGSSNSNIRFVRHILSPEECLYWFRADTGPNEFGYIHIEEWDTVYWYSSGFVDGAQAGSNNFVLLHSSVTDNFVGVLQYLIDDSGDADAPARLIAYAVNLDGLTFEEGVAAIQAIPEPSAIAFAAVAVLGAMAGLRRRR